MDNEESARNFFYSVLTSADDLPLMKTIIQEHLDYSVSLDQVLMDHMVTIGRLAMAVRSLASIIEENTDDFDFVAYLREKALEEEIDGG